MYAVYILHGVIVCYTLTIVKNSFASSIKSVKGVGSASTGGGLKAEAKYGGTRGNAFSYSVTANPVSGFDVTVYLDSSAVEEFEGISTAEELADSEYISFTAAESDISAVNTTGLSLAEADEEFQKQIAEVESQIAEYENTARDAFNIMGTPESADGFLQNIANMADEFDTVTDSAEETIEVLTKEEAVSDVWSSNEVQITELAKAYNDAYISISSDLDGMFGLFEEAKMNLEETLSLDSAISNLKSQIDYFNQYEEAINKLSEMKIDNNIIEQLYPEQAVAFAQELGNLESIDPAAAEAKINELNGAFDKLSEAKDKTAESMADVETEFSTKLDEMQKDIRYAIRQITE